MENKEIALTGLYNPSTLDLRENKKKELKTLNEEAKKALEVEIVDNKTKEVVHAEQMKLKNARIEAEVKAREEQEKLEKKKKYQAFLDSIGLTESNKDEFTFIDTPEGRKFYKFVGAYKK